ncbi:MAG: DUF1622 domain-containing protein [Actinobacteria bacterium]|nr:DUF1622 domain-containing protein [Actinomycetota bacterium]
MDYNEIVDIIGRVIDSAGVIVMLVGIGAATFAFCANWFRREHKVHDSYRLYRQSVGRSILLGLELLIAGDIIRTVALDLTYKNLGTLAILVAIRTFLSINLEMEVERRWPWQSYKTTVPAKNGKSATAEADNQAL